MPETKSKNTQSEIFRQFPHTELEQAIKDEDRAKIIELVNSSMPLAEILPDTIKKEAVSHLRDIRIHANLGGRRHDMRVCFNRLIRIKSSPGKNRF